MKWTGIIPATLLFIGAASHADHDYLEIGHADNGTRWYPAQQDMEPGEYAATIRYNRGLLLNSLRGPTLTPAEDNTLQFDLDLDGPLQLKLRDTTRSRRALMLEFRRDW